MTPSWSAFLDTQQGLPYYKELQQALAQRRASGEIVYPPESDVLKAFKMTELSDTKVVILGQDPYHGPHQAHGLAFSVARDINIPPSLRNIFKELDHEFSEYQIPMHGDLSHWAEQGVLLLNTVLTVAEGEPNSHSGLGWQNLTHAAVRYVSDNVDNVVFMLWGAHAQKLSILIDNRKHCVLKAPHPSPLSAHRGFFGCRHFIMANQWLSKKGKPLIEW